MLNGVLVFWINNSLLDGDFLWLGAKWATAPSGTVDLTRSSTFKDFNGEKMNKEELLYRTFPRRAECKLNFIGTGGDMETTNYYCILGANSLSQYIFLLLWFCYAIIIFINVLNLLRVVLMVLKVGHLRSLYLSTVIGTPKVMSNYLLNTFVVGN